MHSASFTAQTEVDGAGTQTTAFPAASAGAISSARHRVRPVPGRDHADDTSRDPVREDSLRRVDRGRHRAGEAGRIGRRHAPVDDELLDFAVRLRVERLPLIERERQREIISPFLDEIGDSVHGCGALEGRQ